MQYRMSYKSILFILVILLLISCGYNVNTYEKDQINNISIVETAHGSLKLTIVPILETLYAFPGILLKEENDAVIVEFVRCHINSNCRVDVKATTNPDTPGSYNIIIPNTEKPIKIKYRSGAIQVWPQTRGGSPNCFSSSRGSISKMTSRSTGAAIRKVNSNNFLSGGFMLEKNNVTDRVTVCTATHNDRAFGFVTEWFADARPAKVKLSDGSEWSIAGDNINRYRRLIEYSRDYKEPILLAVNNKFQTIGMIFSTMVGIPELNGETKGGKEIQVSVPPSSQMFRLRKDRPWFNAVKRAIIEARNLSDSTKSHHLYVAFDSFENEIVDVRPASK